MKWVAPKFGIRKSCFCSRSLCPCTFHQIGGKPKEDAEFVWEQGIPHLFDINAGVCHQVMPEAGLVWPGMLLVATDSHTTTHGAFGAFGTGVGATDLAAILISGELWFRVPEVIKIRLEGKLQPGTMAKDVVLHLISELGTDGAVYKAIEYTGSTVSALSMAERMVICNMAVEMGAKTSYIQPDEKTLAYIKKHSKQNPIIFDTDPAYQYSDCLFFDVSNLEPQVALPHSVDRSVPIGAAPAIKVDQCFIGTCTGGRVEDFAVAAKILAGKRIHPRTRLVVIPASRQVLLECINLGYIQALIEAGATISTPGCGPCLGAHEGVLAPGEVCVTASNRNFPGRMGSTEASIYLASPATVAATALAGALTDPRTVL